MSAAIDIKKQNREALKWILHYPELRRTYIELSEEYSEIGATIYTGMPHNKKVGNPTLSRSIKLVDLKHQEKWLMTIEMMERTLSEKRLAFLEFRRRAEQQIMKSTKQGRPGWHDFVQVEYALWHDKRYGYGYPPNKNTMTKWMDNILEVTVRIAIKQGIL